MHLAESIYSYFKEIILSSFLARNVQEDSGLQ